MVDIDVATEMREIKGHVSFINLSGYFFTLRLLKERYCDGQMFHSLEYIESMIEEIKPCIRGAYRTQEEWREANAKSAT